MNTFTTLKPEERDFSGGRRYIGASEMGALAGINKYKTAYRMWLKLTKDENQDCSASLNEQADWGHNLEPVIVREFLELRYGEVLAEKWYQSRIKGAAKHKMANGVVIHSFTEARLPGFDFCVAHGDALVIEPEILEHSPGADPIPGITYLIEAKTTSAYNKRGVDPRNGYDFDADSDKGIPLGVYLQIQWQMACYGVHTAYTCCLMGGQKWKMFGPTNYVPKIAEKLLAKAQKMWRHVEAKEPVQPGDFEDVCHLFPTVEKKTSTVVSAEVEDEAVAKMTRYASLGAKAKKIKEEREDIRNGFALAIKGNNYLEASDGTKLATQICKQRRKFDRELFVKEHPEIATAIEEEKYTITSESREIRVANPPKTEG